MLAHTKYSNFQKLLAPHTSRKIFHPQYPVMLCNCPVCEKFSLEVFFEEEVVSCNNCYYERDKEDLIKDLLF